MNTLLNILAALESVELAALQSKVPIISTGVGGEILSISLIAEEDLQTFLAALKSTTSTTTTTTTPSTAAPTAVVISPTAQ